MPLAHAVESLGWQADPLVLVGAAIVAIGYLTLVVRARTTTGRAPPTSALAFAAGLLTCVLAVESPLDAIGEERLISAHMVQHELLATVAPLLLVVGLDYRITAPVFGPVLRPLVRHPGSRGVLRTVTDPRTALTLWSLAVGGWHVPVAYGAALRSDTVHILQHSSLLVGGVLLWLPVLRPLPSLHRLSVRAKLVYLGCAGVAGGAVAAALLWAPGLLYGDYADEPPLWLSSRQLDQRLAGGLMMAVDMTLVLGVAVWVAVRNVAGRELGIPHSLKEAGTS